MPGGRPRKGADYQARIRVNWRIEPEVAAGIETAVKRENRHRKPGNKFTRNAYVDRALRQALETDGILPPKEESVKPGSSSPKV
jgi:hypothetical protein